MREKMKNQSKTYFWVIAFICIFITRLPMHAYELSDSMKIEFVKRLLFLEIVSNDFAKNYQSQLKKRNWTSMENDSLPIKDVFYMSDYYIQLINVREDTTNNLWRDRFKIYRGYQCCSSPSRYFLVAIGAKYKYYLLGGFKASSFNEFIKNEIQIVDEANVLEVAKLYYRTMKYQNLDFGFKIIETIDELKLYNLEDKASIPKSTIMNNTLVLETYFYSESFNDLYHDTFIFKDNQLFDYKRNVVIEGDPDD
jgi:hypothetical protein